MNRLNKLLRISLSIVILGAIACESQAVDRPVMFAVDNTQSSVTIETGVQGQATDTDSSPLSGSINSILSIDPSGGTPLINGLNFTGGSYTADNTMMFDLPLLGGILNIHIDALGLGGTLNTSAPPASITSTGGGNLSYTFNASDHTTAFNQGILDVSDFITTQVNLATLEDPVEGPGPATPAATINLTQGSTVQNLTQFTAALNFPINFSDTIAVDESNNADVTVTGTLVATGSFAVDIGLTGSNELLLPGDPIIAIDTDGSSLSASPPGEGPEKSIDGLAGANKYLNFGGANSGFIVTPASGSSQVQSMRFSTAQDFVERDPATWELYGTNETISSANHSLGTSENWTFIDTGTTDTPATRDAQGSFVDVSNGNTYSSYKILFPTTKNLGDPIMHLGEAEFFTGTGGTGSAVLDPNDPILAIDADFLPQSDYPVNESPANAIDGAALTKYLNFGDKNSGFIVTPTVGSSVIDGFQITTANDADLRDPAAWALYGTNDAIVSEDNSLGDGENWVLIDFGAFDPNEVPLARLTEGDVVSVTNTSAYTSYRMIFTDLRDTNDPIMQIGDIQFFGSLATSDNADFDGNGLVDGLDFLIWQQGLGSGSTQSQGDADGDGDVDNDDLVIWENQYGSAPPISAALSTVPEPGTLVLVLASLVVTPLLNRRRVLDNPVVQ